MIGVEELGILIGIYYDAIYTTVGKLTELSLLRLQYSKWQTEAQVLSV